MRRAIGSHFQRYLKLRSNKSKGALNCARKIKKKKKIDCDDQQIRFSFR